MNYKIPGAAVQAALDSWFSPELENHKELHFDDMKELIAAVTPYLQLGFEVKAGYRVDAYDLQMNGKSVPLERALSCEATKTVDVAAVQSSALIELLDDMRFTLENMGSTDETDAYLIERILAHVDNLRSLSAEPAQGKQCQPIETAPNHQSILIHCDDGKIELVDADDNDYSWAAYTGKENFCAKPTHWMPLPSAPTSEAGRAALAKGGE